jgi:hypothetical protein
LTITHQLHKIIHLDDQTFVTELYRRLLEREPDEGGYSNHVRMLQKGTPRHRLLISFLQSDEAVGLYSQSTPSIRSEASPTVCSSFRSVFAKKPELFVQCLYQELLCREPDPASYRGYVEDLRKGADKANVYIRFINSSEFEGLVRLDKYAFARRILDQLIHSFYTN